MEHSWEKGVVPLRNGQWAVPDSMVGDQTIQNTLHKNITMLMDTQAGKMEETKERGRYRVTHHLNILAQIWMDITLQAQI